MITSAEDALNHAILHIKSGLKIEEIGSIIGKKIEEYGFEPIRNLQGHSLNRFTLHAGLSIPNYPMKSNKTLKEGQVLAIEPLLQQVKGMLPIRV